MDTGQRRRSTGLEPVTFFLCGMRCLPILRSLLASSVLNHIKPAFVVEREPAAVDDAYEPMRQSLASAGFAVRERDDGEGPTGAWKVAIGWKWMIRESRRLLVFHDSLLPKYRGFNPLVSALCNREEEIGVSCLMASSEFDRGDLISQQAVAVRYPIKVIQAIESLVPAYVTQIESALRTIIRGETFRLEPQDERLASYSVWLDEADYCIDWTRDAEQIRAQVDAVGFPYFGAATLWGPRKVRVHDVSVEPDVKVENRAPGKTLFVRDGKPLVICGRGLIRIENATFDDNGQSCLPIKAFKRRFLSGPRG